MQKITAHAKIHDLREFRDFGMAIQTKFGQRNVHSVYITLAELCLYGHTKITEAVNFSIWREFLHVLQFCIEISDVKRYKLNIKRLPSFIWSRDVDMTVCHLVYLVTEVTQELRKMTMNIDNFIHSVKDWNIA